MSQIHIHKPLYLFTPYIINAREIHICILFLNKSWPGTCTIFFLFSTSHWHCILFLKNTRKRNERNQPQKMSDTYIRLSFHVFLIKMPGKFVTLVYLESIKMRCKFTGK